MVISYTTSLGVTLAGPCFFPVGHAWSIKGPGKLPMDADADLLAGAEQGWGPYPTSLLGDPWKVCGLPVASLSARVRTFVVNSAARTHLICLARSPARRGSARARTYLAAR